MSNPSLTPRIVVHEDPPRLRAFFDEAAAFTNNFDVRGQNKAALEKFTELQQQRKAAREEADGADGADGTVDG